MRDMQPRVMAPTPTRQVHYLDAHVGDWQGPMLPVPPPSLDTVRDAICEAFSICRRDLLSEHRDKCFIPARHAFCYLARRLTTCSTTRIGRYFGRDHTVILLAFRKYEGLLADAGLAVDPDMKPIDAARVLARLERQRAPSLKPGRKRAV
jgi:hypothetical protein